MKNPLVAASHQSEAGQSENLIERFTSEVMKVGGEVCKVNNHLESIAKITEFITSSGLQTIMVSRESVIVENGYYSQMREKLRSSIKLEECSPGTTGNIFTVHASVIYAPGLIADTGTIVLKSSKDQPRSLALLPETVIVVASSSRLVRDMVTMTQWLEQEKILFKTSAVTFVTGPSRTADIEKIIVKGVHGPGRLFIILVTG